MMVQFVEKALHASAADLSTYCILREVGHQHLIYICLQVYDAS